MKLNYEFGFLEKDCPLVSRELVRPWRLAALAVGLGILIAGSHLTPSADWDYPICFIMGLWAYVFAPWTCEGDSLSRLEAASAGVAFRVGGDRRRLFALLVASRLRRIAGVSRPEHRLQRTALFHIRSCDEPPPCALRRAAEHLRRFG